MKNLKKILFIAILSFAIPAQLFAKNITIVATGGTIAGAGESATGAKYNSSQLLIEQIASAIPGIDKLANIKTDQLLNIASQDMNDESWLKIVKEVNNLLDDKNVDGIVITHGTDTLEETAYLLNLTVKSKKPIIVVGSMRPSTSISADGPINLYNAVALAASKEAEGKGVLIVMNDEIFSARDASKTNTTSVHTFKANNSGTIGRVHYGKSQIYYTPNRIHTKNSEFTNIKDLSVLPKVEIAYMYAGQDAIIIDNLVASGAQAIVIAGVGDGNVYKDALPKLIEASKKGVVIVRSSRGGSGFVEANTEINDDEYGFITADNLSPQKARILIKVALTKTKDKDKLKEIFAKY
jgi:L-asparaginase